MAARSVKSGEVGRKRTTHGAGVVWLDRHMTGQRSAYHLLPIPMWETLSAKKPVFVGLT